MPCPARCSCPFVIYSCMPQCTLHRHMGQLWTVCRDLHHICPADFSCTGWCESLMASVSRRLWDPWGYCGLLSHMHLHSDSAAVGIRSLSCPCHLCVQRERSVLAHSCLCPLVHKPLMAQVPLSFWLVVLEIQICRLLCLVFCMFLNVCVAACPNMVMFPQGHRMNRQCTDQWMQQSALGYCHHGLVHLQSRTWCVHVEIPFAGTQYEWMSLWSFQ